MVAMLLSFAKQFKSIHVGDVLEACFKECSGALDCFGYSACVFAVVSFIKDGLFQVDVDFCVSEAFMPQKLFNMIGIFYFMISHCGFQVTEV
jgi:hypothetical protein